MKKSKKKIVSNSTNSELKDSKGKKLKDFTSEEVCETFSVEKKGEENLVKTCGTIPVEHATKEQITAQNKILKNILIGIAVFIAVFLIAVYLINSSKHFEYEGVKFDVYNGNVLKGKIIYGTSIPTVFNGQLTSYNFFIRNDPRKLEDISFEGDLILKKNIVIEMNEEFKCEGEEIIAIANLVKLLEFFGGDVIKDENASCDIQGRYSHIKIQRGEITKIENVGGPSCYILYVKDCEILKATEKFMLEGFINFNEKPKE